MSDQVIDAAIARALHAADACRDHTLVGWVVMRDAPGYPDRFIARLATKRLSPYVLLADTLAGVQEQLSPGLVRVERQPADPPEVVEICLRDHPRPVLDAAELSKREVAKADGIPNTPWGAHAGSPAYMAHGRMRLLRHSGT
ncbi:MAG: hypothetical protein ACJ8AW_26695 [Rhodopila sp.]